LLRPVEQWLVFAPEQAQLLALPYRDGQQVPAGTVLMEMQSRQLNARSDKHQASLARLGWQAQVAGLDAEARKDWHVLNEQWQTARAEEASLFAEAVRYRPVAPFVAVLRDQPPDLRPEEWLTHRELLGRLLPDGPLQVVTYVDESDVHRLRIGDRGLFMAEGLAGPSLPLQVAAIDQDATRTLAEGELATLFGAVKDRRDPRP
jgi:putative peptide zinc metalloprotease protein